jgi:cytochrome c oxidase subunit 2
MIDLLIPLAANGGAPVQTPSTFSPVSTPAIAIREIAFLVLGITGIIFVLVAGLVIYTIVRFRRRTGDRPLEPPQVYGSSNRIELAWTVVPFLIVIVLFLVTARRRFAQRSLGLVTPEGRPR